MQLNPQYTVSFIKGLPPLLCKRLLYYSDPMFRQARGLPMLWWLLLAAGIGLTAWALMIQSSETRREIENARRTKKPSCQDGDVDAPPRRV